MASNIAKPPSAEAQPDGRRVANSSAYLPRHAIAGASVDGHAPIGSQVYFLQQQIEVQDDGRFVLVLPVDASGELPVRIVRPAGQTPLTLKIIVDSR